MLMKLVNSLSNLKISTSKATSSDTYTDASTLRIKPTAVNYPTSNEMQEAFNEAIKRYGTDTAQWAERLMRWETAHFKSKQFGLTYSAGMEVPDGIKKFPYGWTSMKKFWEDNPNFAPVGWVTMHENAGDQADKNADRFVKFPSFKAALFSLCEYLVKYGNNAGRWYSTDAAAQARYEDKLRTVKPRFV